MNNSGTLAATSFDLSYSKKKKKKRVRLGKTHRSGHGRRERAVVHVGFVVHVGHHDVTWVTRVGMPFTVQILELSWK